MCLPRTAPLSQAPSHASRAAACSEHPLGVPGARAGGRCVAGLLGAKQLCMLPGHPSLHSPVLSGVPPGMGCKSQPLSLFSSCRAPGDEEAQAENLITANGKATRPACSAAASAQHQPAAELAARDGGFALGWVLQTALLFPLQPRERRKQRTEHEPCGESQGGHGPAQAGAGGGTGAITAAVLGGKGEPVGLQVAQSAGTGQLCSPTLRR